MQTTRTLLIALLALFVVVGCSSNKEKPDVANMPNGSIHIENWNIQAIATMAVGKGKLGWNGQVYEFEIGGVGAGGVGINKIDATGQVHHLKDIRDFSGKYFEVKASGTIVAGAAGIAMENDKGVVIKLVSKNKGVQLSVGPKGIDITMK